MKQLNSRAVKENKSKVDFLEKIIISTSSLILETWECVAKEVRFGERLFSVIIAYLLCLCSHDVYLVIRKIPLGDNKLIASFTLVISRNCRFCDEQQQYKHVFWRVLRFWFKKKKRAFENSWWLMCQEHALDSLLCFIMVTNWHAACMIFLITFNSCSESYPGLCQEPLSRNASLSPCSCILRIVWYHFGSTFSLSRNKFEFFICTCSLIVNSVCFMLSTISIFDYAMCFDLPWSVCCRGPHPRYACTNSRFVCWAVGAWI